MVLKIGQDGWTTNRHRVQSDLLSITTNIRTDQKPGDQTELLPCFTLLHFFILSLLPQRQRKPSRYTLDHHSPSTLASNTSSQTTSCHLLVLCRRQLVSTGKSRRWGLPSPLGPRRGFLSPPGRRRAVPSPQVIVVIVRRRCRICHRFNSRLIPFNRRVVAAFLPPCHR
ncbi:hypothetical protein PIB30_073188 [Stylosanthes scabra]|uniref:Uncharacterized protein n=1 Tax=Stylosanthes scabra TaxID=79078 RepID=A0ABU6VNB7_9FABA|nr:hypothetical protein [Stylosanthes scabra]